MASTQPCRGTDAVIGDLAGTGLAHAVVACGPESAVAVYRHEAGGTDQAGVQVGAPVAVAGAPVAVAACDLDQDGAEDVVVASTDGTVSVLRADGGGALSSAGTWAAEGPVDVACGDLDRDGWPDVAVLEDAGSEERIRIARGNGDLTLSAWTSSIGLGPERRDPGAFVVADLDGDDVLDFAVAMAFADPVPVVGVVLSDP